MRSFLFITLLLFSSCALGQSIKCLQISNSLDDDIHLITVIAKTSLNGSSYKEYFPIIVGPLERKNKSRWIQIPSHISFIESIEWIENSKRMNAEIRKDLDSSGFYQIFLAENDARISKVEGAIENVVINQPYGFTLVLNGFDEGVVEYSRTCSEERELLIKLRKVAIEGAMELPQNVVDPVFIQAYQMGYQNGLFSSLFSSILIHPDHQIMSSLVHELRIRPGINEGSVIITNCFAEGFSHGLTSGKKALDLK